MATGYELWLDDQLTSALDYTRNLLLMKDTIQEEKRDLLFNDLGRLVLERFVREQEPQ